MTCPVCGMRQWHYNPQTLTCKNGHHVTLDGRPELLQGLKSPAILVPATAIATVALDLLSRAAF